MTAQTNDPHGEPVALAPECHGRVGGLFDPATPNAPMLWSLLEGRSPGDVLVDDASRPAAALAILQYHGIAFAGGDASAEFVARAIRGRGPVLLVNGAHSAGAVLERVEFCARMDPLRARRDGLRAIVPGIALRPLTAADVDHCLWRSEVLGACGSAERFAESGFGVLATAGSALAAEAYACFVGRGDAEIGVVTHSEYRRRGLAVAACSALIEKCLERGLEPTWSCWRGNAASIATARALGFIDERPYRFVRVVAPAAS